MESLVREWEFDPACLAEALHSMMRWSAVLDEVYIASFSLSAT